LANDIPLPIKHRDHVLTGNWKNYRDCHIHPDLVLIYRLFEEDQKQFLRLVLARLDHILNLDCNVRII